MSSCSSNHVESNIDGLSVGPSGIFRQNLGRLRIVLNHAAYLSVLTFIDGP
jgi:hypothetical protein